MTEAQTIYGPDGMMTLADKEIRLDNAVLEAENKRLKDELEGCQRLMDSIFKQLLDKIKSTQNLTQYIQEHQCKCGGKCEE